MELFIVISYFIMSCTFVWIGVSLYQDVIGVIVSVVIAIVIAVIAIKGGSK